MINKKITRLLAAFMVLLFFACDKEEDDAQRQMKLQSVGFSGNMPNEWKFGTTGITAQNSVSGPSGLFDGSYIVHSFSIVDTVNGFTIIMELPAIKYSNDYMDVTDLNAAVRRYFSYDRVKEKLSVGDKILLTMQNRDVTTGFNLQLRENTNHIGYAADYEQDATSYLKVTELIESSEPDPVLGQVKTLDVTFAVDVNMARIYPVQSYLPPQAKLKGLLRMKYREI